MTVDTTAERRALAERLQESRALTSPRWRVAVESVPRELFLRPGVFLPIEGDTRWQPATPKTTDTTEWVKIAYSDQSLVTQLDGCLTADQVSEPVAGIPTSSSTLPTTVISMIEALDIHDGDTVLEIGTGTGYSSALMCHRLGVDNVTTMEVDPDVAARADDALEDAGYSTWTVTGDGLLGYPHRAPYDRIIATCAVRRIPYTWVRQTRPDGVILATVGTWTHGTGLAKLVVGSDGTGEGRIIGRSSFMHARAQAPVFPSGDLAARAAYADSERETTIGPDLLREWMPAFLAQLTAPDMQLVAAISRDGTRTHYAFDTGRESFATLTANGTTWSLRQGGPVALWDEIEDTISAWRAAGTPSIEDIHLEVTKHGHTYWCASTPSLRWEHPVA